MVCKPSRNFGMMKTSTWIAHNPFPETKSLAIRIARTRLLFQG
ncbi:hypothetical protein CCACVL1_19569, partial [Corchorus capsularis]